MWQLSNGIAFIQMIYAQGEELIDCEYVRQKSFISDFLKQFYDEVNQAKARNFTTPADSWKNTKPMHQVTDRDFRRFNEENIIPEDYYEPAEDAFGMRNLTYHQIRQDTDLPDDIKPLMNYKHLKAQCDERHRQMQKIVHHMNDENEEKRVAASDHLDR